MNQLTSLDPQAIEQVNGSPNQRRLESFFDHDPGDPKREKSLWMMPNKNQADMRIKVIMEAQLEKQGRKTHTWKVRHYILADDFLAYKEKQGSKTIKKVMPLDRVKLECIELNDSNKKRAKYGFCFSKNQKSATLFTTDLSLYERLKTELEKRCILLRFEENYEIEKLIGRGSFGKVYLVKNKKDGNCFAAKMFFKDSLLKQTKGKLSLISEIKNLRILDHTGIMKLYQVYETTLGIFLIMELLEGGELFEHLKQRRTFTERDCALMLIKIIGPLVYMHEKNTAHRDIKPENLILRSRDEPFNIVIADFGLAQDMSKPALFVKCGSPGYCAPEILNSKGDVITYDLKCDVYSVGCVFYHMVAGKNPFWSKYHKETYHFNKEGNVDFEDEKIASLSPSAFDLLTKMMEKDPKKRPSFKECLDHPFFREAFQEDELKSPLIKFNEKPAVRLKLIPQKASEPEIKEKPEEIITSFVFGRANMIRGKTDTLQEVSMAVKTKGVKSNLLQLIGKSETLSPGKLNSFGLQQLSGQILSRDISISDDSDPESMNDDSSEIGRLGGFEKPEEIGMKVSQVKNNGMINNPFSEVWYTEKEVNPKMAMSEQGIKHSLVVFSSQGLSTKSEELPNFYKGNI